MPQSNWGAEDGVSNYAREQERLERQAKARREDRTTDVRAAAKRRRSI